MANDKVYIHEFIDIIGHNRAHYMHHMTANWSPQARAARHQLCYGVWGVVGSTGPWPKVVNIWEERLPSQITRFAGLLGAEAFEVDHAPGDDPPPDHAPGDDASSSGRARGW